MVMSKMESAADSVLGISVLDVTELDSLVASLESSGEASFEATGSTIPTSGIRLHFMDEDVHPGDDFFRYANGRWLDKVVIPEWATATGAYYESDWSVRDQILEIIKSEPDGLAHKFFTSAIDAKARDVRGVAPLKAELDKIMMVKSLNEFVELMGYYAPYGVVGLFSVSVEQSTTDSSVMLPTIYPSEFTLVDGLHYYDKRYAAKRRKYKGQIKELLGAFGFDKIDEMARRIFNIELAVAEGYMDMVDSTDLVKISNQYRVDELRKLLGDVSLDAWSKGAGVGSSIFNVSTVTDPGLLSRLVRKIGDFDEKSEVAKNWKAWLVWRVIVSLGCATSTGVNDKIFALKEGHAIRPSLELRATDFIGDYFGDSVASTYVKRYLDSDKRDLALSICKAVVDSTRMAISRSVWCEDATRDAALAKLDKLVIEVGEPHRYMDLSGLEFVDSYFENYLLLNSYYIKDEWSRVGAFVPGMWDFGPHTVNACYSTPDNTVCLPAAFMQSPWLDLGVDMAANFAIFGSTVGHEVSHGFDDQGARFDGSGNLVNWWSGADLEEFSRRGEVIIDHYNLLKPWQGDGDSIDGEVTLGENLADITGIRVALDAFKSWLEENGGGEVVDGFTPIQRFFITYAQANREIARSEAVEEFYFGTSHSPDEFRVNQVFKYVDEFYEAFGVGPEHKLWMSPTDRISIW